MPDKKIEVSVSGFAEDILAKEGVLDLPAYVHNLVEQEATRLYHIHRSRPKVRTLPAPPGRPRQGPLQKRVREVGNILREVYLKLRATYGEEFTTHFGEQERELEAAIVAEDLVTLERFTREQPWVRRKGG